jgi:hypothetical protein
MSEQDQIAELLQQRDAVDNPIMEIRDAAFLHSDRFPLNEKIAGYPAAPLNLFHYNLLRMMGSPFLPPFATPGPDALAAFLWVVNPGFIPGTGKKATRARRRFLKTCQCFVKPAFPVWGTSYAIKKWERRAGQALDLFTRTVTAAREYVREALEDRPPAGEGGDEISYYSDFCQIAGSLMRNYPGLRYREIMFLPLKVVCQFQKEIREHNAAQAGEPALLWNRSDDVNDKILELINRSTRN